MEREMEMNFDREMVGLEPIIKEEMIMIKKSEYKDLLITQGAVERVVAWRYVAVSRGDVQVWQLAQYESWRDGIGQFDMVSIAEI